MSRDDHREDDALLAAYVDGVGELTPEERKRVEARLAAEPSLRTDEAATRTLLATLRSVPPEGTDPDWARMARAISDEVGPTVPRAWWRPSWRWLVPATALALGAVVFALWLQRPAPRATVALRTDAASNAPVSPSLPAVAEATTMPMWLDGDAVEVDLQAGELLDVDDALLGHDDSFADGLLPVEDLAWVDELADDEIDAAEAMLETTDRKKG